MPEHPKYLIFRTDRLGDLIQTLPMAQVIKQHQPNAKVIIALRNYTEPIARLSPFVDELLLWNRDWTLGKKSGAIRALRPDAVFFPVARPDEALAAFLTRVPRRIGTAYRAYSLLYNVRQKVHRREGGKHEARYNVEMLSAIGMSTAHVPRTTLDLSKVQPTANFADKPFAVLHIGTGGSTDVWPRDKFVQIAAWMARDLGLTIILTGTEPERESLISFRAELERIAGGLTRSSVQIFIEELDQLALLLSNAAVVVSGATGPGHLAAALGTPTIGFFPLAKAISKERWGFRGPNVMNFSPSAGKGCAECNDCNCIEAISVAEVQSGINCLMRNEN